MKALPQKKLTLPRAARLRKTYQYDMVRAYGKKKRGSLFQLLSFSTSEKETACGIIVSRRVGGAVVRNQIKRRFRDLYRRERAHLFPGLWISIIATPKAASATIGELYAEWLRLGRYLSIFK